MTHDEQPGRHLAHRSALREMMSVMRYKTDK